MADTENRASDNPFFGSTSQVRSNGPDLFVSETSKVGVVSSELTFRIEWWGFIPFAWRGIIRHIPKVVSDVCVISKSHIMSMMFF